MHRLAALLLATCLAGPALAQTTYALVIGVDSYDSIPGLSGAVNDARDIADALTGIGAQTVLLTDHDASREAIIAEWTRLAEQAQPGDRLIVTYAGHGSNEAEAIAGEEVDGRDENWLLAGFSPFGEAAGERIRDNEIAALIGLNPAVQVILVSDSCHSGTVSREIMPVLGYRYYRTDGTLADDPLPPLPPPPAEGAEFGALALYMGAVPDAEQVPEFLIDGAPRGALSWAFAAGLRGGADGDGDGVVSARELEGFVRTQVRDISRGLQRPQIEADAAVLLAFGAGAPPVVLADLSDVPAGPGTGDDAPAIPDGETPVELPAPDAMPDPGPAVDDMPETPDDIPVEVAGTDEVPDPGPGDGDSAETDDDIPVEVAENDDTPDPDTGEDGAETAGDKIPVDVTETDDVPDPGPADDDSTDTTADDTPVDVAETDDADPFLTAFADLPPVTLAAPAGLASPEGATLLPAGVPADLVLDPATGEIRTMVGDLFTTLPGGDAAALQKAVDNARIAAELMRPGRMQSLAVSFAEGDGTYRDGDLLTVRVEGRQTPHLALFSLSPDGALVPIYPLNAPALGLNDPATLPPGATLDLTTQVGAPFGSDFLVAVETEAPSDALALLLADPERLWDARSLWEALQMADLEGAAPRVAVFPFHSRGQ